MVVDGTLLVDAGIGTRSTTGSGPGDGVANFPSNLTALCVPGTSGCAACNDGADDGGDFSADANDVGCVASGDNSEVLGDLDFDALFPGSVLLSLAVTPGDLAEGFALETLGAGSTASTSAPRCRSWYLRSRPPGCCSASARRAWRRLRAVAAERSGRPDAGCYSRCL